MYRRIVRSSIFAEPRILSKSTLKHSIEISPYRMLSSSEGNDSVNDIQTRSDYENVLRKYFEQTNFQFRSPTEKQKLEKWMRDIFLRNKLLVALDVEAWERNTNKVIEIGIAIYDPSQQYGSVIPIINQIHIIIKEHERMLNGRFCPNNKDKFMGGNSYCMSLVEAKKFLQLLFGEHIQGNSESVLVGHHISGDISWLRSIGVNIPENLDIVDTEKLYRLSFEIGGTLRGILRAVNIPHGYLHNAANDAYYTLLAAFAYCDPSHRKMFNLDTFVERQESNLTPEERKQKKRTERFYDRANRTHCSSGVQLYNVLFEGSSSDTSNL